MDPVFGSQAFGDCATEEQPSTALPVPYHISLLIRKGRFVALTDILALERDKHCIAL